MTPGMETATSVSFASEEPVGGLGYVLLAFDLLAFWVVVIVGLVALLS